MPPRTRLKIGWSSGYTEAYWGDWFAATQLGGSERIVVEVACAQAAAGHEVSVRLPYAQQGEVSRRGVRWIGLDAPSEQYDVLFCADDHARRDRGGQTILVCNRSDPPPTTDFDALCFLSQHHARFAGHAGSPSVGGGVDLADYLEEVPRLPNRVICTSSPDRCPRARQIGKGFDFQHAYKPVQGFQTTLYERSGLIHLQQSAQVLIYPLEPSRPSDFFSMAVLESMAAGTPVVVSDADSQPEMWSESAIVLPNPVRLSEWNMAVEELLVNRELWHKFQSLGRMRAADLTWTRQAERYLAVALEA